MDWFSIGYLIIGLCVAIYNQVRPWHRDMRFPISENYKELDFTVTIMLWPLVAIANWRNDV